MKLVPSRTVTTLAVGFLTLDALLLGYAGVVLGRPWVVVAGIVCAIGAGLVVAGWRRYRRVLEELEAARAEMKREVESLRELLQSRNSQH